MQIANLHGDGSARPKDEHARQVVRLLPARGPHRVCVCCNKKRKKKGMKKTPQAQAISHTEERGKKKEAKKKRGEKWLEKNE